jgi:hypothetical protein
MAGEASRSPVLERLEALVGEWVTHGTIGARAVARGRTTIAFALSYSAPARTGRCPR